MTEEHKYYRHFKGGKYELLATGYYTETVEEVVIYRALYGERKIWVRPKSMFFETILRDGRMVQRFQEIPKEEALSDDSPSPSHQ